MSKTTCSVSDCAATSYARGMCNRHYIEVHSEFTCADCGKGMHKAKTSRPQGEAKCLACRRAHGEPGMYRNGCRCDECKAAHSERMSGYFREYKTATGKSWSTDYRRRQSEELGYWPTRRHGVSYTTRRNVYERDSWKCQICKTETLPTADPHSDWYPSLDHVAPQATVLLADHSVHGLRTAHRWCNAVRGDGRVTDKDVRQRALARMLDQNTRLAS